MCGVLGRFIGDMQAKCVLYQAVNPFSDKTAAVSVLVKDFEGRPLQVPTDLPTGQGAAGGVVQYEGY
jgi:hypothetical protein